MLQGEHSARLLTFIRLPLVIKIFVLSIFDWPFYTGFTVQHVSYSFPEWQCVCVHWSDRICEQWRPTGYGNRTWDGPRSYATCRKIHSFTLFSLSEHKPSQHIVCVIFGLPAKRHLNGVLLAGLWWPVFRCSLGNARSELLGSLNFQRPWCIIINNLL